MGLTVSHSDCVFAVCRGRVTGDKPAHAYSEEQRVLFFLKESLLSTLTRAVRRETKVQVKEETETERKAGPSP